MIAWDAEPREEDFYEDELYEIALWWSQYLEDNGVQAYLWARYGEGKEPE